MQRAAGERLNLPAALVAYLGEAAQAGRGPGEGEVRTPEDAAVAERVGAAVAEQLAGGPSFDLRYPKIPGRDLEGVPNADEPLMREKLRQRLLRNPQGSEELPGFLRRAALEGEPLAQVNPTYPAGDQRYGQPMLVEGRPLSLSEAEFDWSQRLNELRRRDPAGYGQVKSMMGPHGWMAPPAGFQVPPGL
jgi:hypothetical protein